MEYGFLSEEELTDFIGKPLGKRYDWSQITTENNLKINGHDVASNLRMEVQVKDGKEEIVMMGGYLHQFDNEVEIVSAKSPASAYMNFFDSIMDGDDIKQNKALDQIFSYNPPSVLGKKQYDDKTKDARRYLEYAFIESGYWVAAARRQIALLNPSKATLTRVMKTRGEYPVYFTRRMIDANDYWNEIQIVMREHGYVKKPVRCSLDDLPQDYSYYLGFSGGFDTKHVVPHFFGFESNPYHQDTLTGVIKGLEIQDQYVEMYFQKTGYDRIERYYQKPIYNRYYGDVVVPALTQNRSWGIMSYNFITDMRMEFPNQNTEYDGEEIIVDAWYVHKIVHHEQVYNGITYLVSEQGNIIDVKDTLSPENRYKLMIDDGVNYDWNKNPDGAVYMLSRSKTNLIPLPVPQVNNLDDTVNGKYIRSSYRFQVQMGNKMLDTSRGCATHVMVNATGDLFRYYRGVMHGTQNKYVCLRKAYVEVIEIVSDGKPYFRYKGYNHYAPSTCIENQDYHLSLIDDYYMLKREYLLTDIFYSRMKHGVEYSSLSYRRQGLDKLVDALSVDLRDLSEGINQYLDYPS